MGVCIHDATCSMQPVASYRIASCVLEKLRVTSSVKLLQVNRIMLRGASKDLDYC